jgi:hypothetical protein
MKSSYIFFGLCLFLFSFSACQKDYTCGCTFTDKTKNFDVKIEKIAHKNDAQTICNDYSSFIGNCQLK